MSGKKVGRPLGQQGPTRRNIRKVQEMFQEHGQEALDTMLVIMRDESADKAVRLKAANDILNRGFGTPVSTQIVEKIITDERQSPISPAAISAAGTSELMALADALGRFVSQEALTLDVTPDEDESIEDAVQLLPIPPAGDG